MYEMNEKELEQFISEQGQKVAKSEYERPGSGEYRFESSILKDAKQLLAEKQKKPQPS
jgi:hypothetical protein